MPIEHKKKLKKKKKSKKTIHCKLLKWGDN